MLPVIVKKDVLATNKTEHVSFKSGCVVRVYIKKETGSYSVALIIMA